MQVKLHSTVRLLKLRNGSCEFVAPPRPKLDANAGDQHRVMLLKLLGVFDQGFPFP
jgi:hypothetical protein